MKILERSLRLFNKYRKVGSIYDTDNRDIWKVDIDFFKKLIYPNNKTILDMGCGTGRVSIPLSKEGNIIYCVDHSKSMLNELRNKILHEKLSPNSIKLFCTSMERISFHVKFDFILFPYGSFQQIYVKRHAKECLAKCNKLFNNDGKMILVIRNKKDVFRKKESALKLNFIDFHDNKIDILYQVRNKNDEMNGIVYNTNTYINVSSTGINITKNPIAFKYYDILEIENMLYEAGFEIEKRLTRYNDDQEIDEDITVYICKGREV